MIRFFGVRVIPHHLELTRQIGKFLWLRSGMVASFLEMLGDFGFDLPPAQLSQPLLHRILEFLAFQIMGNLIGGRLPNVEDGLPFQVLGPNLVTHDSSPWHLCPRSVLPCAAAVIAPVDGSSSA